MKKKKKIKVKIKPRKKIAKKSRSVFVVKKKVRRLKAKKIAKHEEEPFVMFDSTNGDTDTLFTPVAEDLPIEHVVTFADYKNENAEKVKEELLGFGAVFCNEVFVNDHSGLPRSSDDSLAMTIWQKIWKFIKKLLPRNMFNSLLMGLIFAGLFSGVVYVFAAWSGSPYSPGEITNPECDPTQTNCTVISSVPYTGATTAVNLGARNFTTSGAGSLGSLTLTTSALTVGNGGTGLGSIAVGSILGANTVDTLTAITSATGTKILTNTAGTISWETASSGMVYPSGSGIPIVASGTSWGTTITDNHTNWDAGYTHKTTEDTINGLVFVNGAGTYSAKAIGTDVQAYSAGLASLAGLTWSSGSPLVKMTAAGTFGLDATAYYKSGDTAVFANVTDSGLTITRIPYAGTAGLLVDSANLTYDGTTLTSNSGFATSSSSTGVQISGSAGVLTLAGQGNTNNENLTFDFETTANKVAIGTGTGVTDITTNLNFTAGQLIDSGLTASKTVFTDANKQLTSTGIGTSSQFIKGDGSLDSSVYLTSLSGGLLATGATTGATSQSQIFTNGVTLSNLTSGYLPVAGVAGLLQNSAGTGFVKVTSGVLSYDNSTYMTNPMTAAGDIIYGGASGTATKLVAGTTGQILQTNTGAAPSWSTAVYPATTTANQILYSTSANVIDGSANLTFDGTNLQISGAGSSQIISTNAPIILGESGGTNSNNEQLSFDFDTATANKVAVTSDTGVTLLDFGTINLNSGGYIAGNPIITGVVSSGPPETTPANGALIVDSGDGGRLYFRYGSAWHYVAQTGGFQIPKEETTDPISGDTMAEGDIVLGRINQTFNDNALHGVWVKWDSVKADLLAEARGELAQDGAVGSGAVAGVSTTTLLDKVTNVLTSLGISIKDGITTIASLSAPKITTDIVTIKQMQMVDSDTGDIYCTWIKNGEWVKVKGECGSLAVADVVAQPSPVEEVNQQLQEAVQQVQQVVQESQEAITQSANDAVNQVQQAAEQAVENQPEEVVPSENLRLDSGDVGLPVAPPEEPQLEQVELPSAGELIQESASSLLNAMWKFINGVFGLGIKNIINFKF